MNLLCFYRNILYIKKIFKLVVKKVREIIFIDHYSTDNTLDIVRELAKKYNRAIVYPRYIYWNLRIKITFST